MGATFAGIGLRVGRCTYPQRARSFLPQMCSCIPKLRLNVWSTRNSLSVSRKCEGEFFLKTGLLFVSPSQTVRAPSVHVLGHDTACAVAILAVHVLEKDAHEHDGRLKGKCAHAPVTRNRVQSNTLTDPAATLFCSFCCNRVSAGRFVLVLSRAQRDLADAITHGHFAGTDRVRVEQPSLVSKFTYKRCHHL